MTKDGAIALITAQQTALTAQDVEDLAACSPDECAELVRSYNDLRKPGPDAWAVVLAIFKECADLANLIVPLEGAIQGAVGIANAAQGKPTP